MCFQISGGSKNQSKISTESLLAPNLAPKASCRPLGLDFWSLLAPPNGPQRGQESKLKFEAFVEAPKRHQQHGPTAAGRPQWEGTFGESTYGRRWASPKLCLSQCFRKLHLASLQRPLVSLKAQWPDLQWACGPKPATEPAVLCASVPQRSQRILWEVISNSVFDRVVGRAQASKRTLERLENELPGTQNETHMTPWRPGSLEAFGRPWGAEGDF